MDFFLDKLFDIILNYFSLKLSYKQESYFTRKRIDAEIQRSLSHVLSSFEPFFESENISEEKQKILIDCCANELKEVLSKPDTVFKSSFSVSKLVESMYPKGSFPQEICEEDLTNIFSVVFSGIIRIVLSYPPILEEWKHEKYKDDTRRFDIIAEELKNILMVLTKTTEANSLNSDKLLTRVKTTLLAQDMFNIEISGLRGERPDAIKMDKCFIIPHLEQYIEDTRRKSKNQAEEVKQLTSLQEMLLTLCGARSKNIVYGVPGSGKSTWARWINMNLIQGSTEKIPIIIRCRDVLCKVELPSLTDIVKEVVGIHLSEEITPQVLREWYDSNKVLIILDGFDEVPPGKRDRFSEWIKGLENLIYPSSILITSRAVTTNHLDQLGSTWNIWNIRSFDEDQIVEYIDKWYKYSPLLNDDSRVINSKKLATEWLHDVTLRPLVCIPLMLTTILMVHHMDGKLPKGRANLYERYINGMLEIWDSRSGVTSQVDMSTHQKKEVLTQLAIHFQFNEVELLDDTEMYVFIEDAEKKAKCSHQISDVLTLLRERTGLIIGPGTWSFMHKNIGEFLVAQAVKDGHLVAENGTRIDRMTLYNERNNDRWSYVLLFWVGLSAISELHEFVDRLVSEGNSTDLGLALEILLDQSETGRLTEPWYSETIIKILAKDFGNIEHSSSKSMRRISYIANPCSISDVDSLDHIFFNPKWNARLFSISTVIKELLRPSNLTIQQVLECNKSILLPVWLCMFDLCVKQEDFEYLLMQCNTNNPVLRKARAFTYTWGIAAVFCQQQISMAEYKIVLERSIPSLKDTFMFHLLGYFTKVIHGFFDRLEGFGLSDYKRLVHDILFFSTEKCNEVWLLSTTKYKYYKSKHGNIDLLKYCLASIDDGVRENLIEDNDDTVALRAFIAGLIDRRDSIT